MQTSSVLRLSAHAAWFNRHRLALASSGLMLALVLTLFGHDDLSIRCGPAPTGLATFNIRNFPERPEQVPAAFETMRDLDVPVIAVQEIGDVATFAAAAREHLGPGWESVFNRENDDAQTQQHPARRVGLAWDGARYHLDSHTTHDVVRVRPGQRPALEVRLTSATQGPALRVIVVHLKAGGEPVDHRLRLEQLMRLRVVVVDALRSGDEVVVVGDFNATGSADRRALRAFAEATQTVWASAELPCTAYWRPDGSCHGSALDHVFTRAAPRTIGVKGACEQAGCSPGKSCPADYERVSDHCPVTLELRQ